MMAAVDMDAQHAFLSEIDKRSHPRQSLLWVAKIDLDAARPIVPVALLDVADKKCARL